MLKSLRGGTSPGLTNASSAIPYGSGRFLKDANREAIMRYVRQMPGASRTDLADRAGLAKATVSDLVNELIADGWLMESAFTGRRIAGRLPRPITLDPLRRRILGCQINAEAAVVTAVTQTGEVTEFNLRDVTGKTPEKIFEVLGMQIAEVCHKLEQERIVVSGVGLAVPGPVHPSNGVLLFSDSAGWKQLPVRDMFATLLSQTQLSHLPMLVARAANCAAQYHFDAEDVPEDESILYVHVGQGIAASVIARGQPVLGVNGSAGAISHTEVEPGGALCSCGKRGCANVSVTMKAMQAKLCMDDSLLRDSYAARDSRVIDVVDEFACGIARLIHDLCLAYDPGSVFVGGHAFRLGAQFQKVIRDRLAVLASEARRDFPRLQAVRFDEHDAARGVAMLMLRSSLARSLYSTPYQPFGARSMASIPERVSFSVAYQSNAA